MSTVALCVIEGCDKPSRARQMCVAHYDKWYRGTLNGPAVKKPVREPAERLWMRFTRDPESGCWVFQRAGKKGYARFAVEHRREVQAHRFSYELLVGPVPEGLELDHLCRNRACVNPAHLEAVTHRENVNRSRTTTTTGEPRDPETHCINGHAYEDHGFVRADGWRGCRICSRAGFHRWKAKQGAAQTTPDLAEPVLEVRHAE